MTELFRKNRVSEAQARTLFDVMEWLVQRHGRPTAPQVQSPLQKTHQTILDSRWTPMEARSLSTWADEKFVELKHASGMGHWSIQISPVIENKCTLEYLHIDNNWNPAAGGPYYVDEYGRAVIIFEQDSCANAGAFASHILIKLAAMRMMNFAPAVGVDLEMGAMMVLSSAAFSGQGFYLLPMAEAISKQFAAKTSAKLSKDSVENGLIFNSCLGLLALNRTSEQIIATYGTAMCPILRQKMRSACRQIEQMESELQCLKEIVNPKREAHLPLPWKQAS